MLSEHCVHKNYRKYCIHVYIVKQGYIFLQIVVEFQIINMWFLMVLKSQFIFVDLELNTVKMKYVENEIS